MEPFTFMRRYSTGSDLTGVHGPKRVSFIGKGLLGFLHNKRRCYNGENKMPFAGRTQTYPEYTKLIHRVIISSAKIRSDAVKYWLLAGTKKNRGSSSAWQAPSSGIICGIDGHLTEFTIKLGYFTINRAVTCERCGLSKARYIIEYVNVFRSLVPAKRFIRGVNENPLAVQLRDRKWNKIAVMAIWFLKELS